MGSEMCIRDSHYTVNGHHPVDRYKAHHVGDISSQRPQKCIERESSNKLDTQKNAKTMSKSQLHTKLTRNASLTGTNNILDLNLYRMGLSTHKHGTPKVLHQISKDAAFMSSVHTATGSRDTR